MTSVIQKPKTATAQNADDANEFLKELRRLQAEKGAKPSEPKNPGTQSDGTQSEPSSNGTQSAKADGTQSDDSGGSGDGTQDYTDNSDNTGQLRDIQRNPTLSLSATAGDVVGVAKGEEKPKPKSRSEILAELIELPWQQFAARAFEIHHRNRDGESWKSKIFEFVWLLSGHPRMEPLLTNAKKALKEIEPCMRSWTAGRIRQGETPPFGSLTDPWLAWFDIPTADARAEFTDLWKKIRYRPGHTPLQLAFEAARKMRLIVTDEMRDKRPVCERGERDESDYEFFVGVAGHLQTVMGNKPILLPCREVGELLKVSPITISRYRRWAIEDGFLKIEKAHSFRSSGTGAATEFRFDTSLYSALSDKAQKGSKASFANITGGKK